MSAKRDESKTLELVTLIDKSGQTAKEGKAVKSGWQSLAGWWRTAKLWFFSQNKWTARGLMLIAIVLALGRIMLLVKISYLVRQFDSTLAAKDKAGFHAALWGWAVIIIIAAPLFALSDYVQDRLKIEWRRWLTTELLNAFYAKQAYYTIHLRDNDIDNPDQRICDDVPYFVDGSTDLMLGIARKIFGVIAFSGVLWRVAPNLVLFLFGYAAIGTFLTTYAFGRKLMSLTYTILKKEGDLRFNLVRTRENSESIAFYGGDGQESDLASSRLRAVVQYAKYKIAWMAGLSLWTNAYSYVTMLLPPILTAPRYFAGEIEFGVITQVGFAFRHIEGALNYLVNNLDKFSSLAAVSQRLDTLLQELLACATLEASITRAPDLNGGLILENFTVETPNSNLKLCQGLELILNEGDSLLIVGPSGCGKSSLLRAISGLWVTGGGKVHTPPQDQLFFLPQKPYMPQGNLRQQLLYPSGESMLPGSAGGNTSRGLATLSDAALHEILSRVSLPDLAERMGGLEEEVEWGHTLSLGEQQRVAFARMLLHEPTLAFLDEATGALDTATENILYTCLRQRSSSYVSIGHRTELYKFHSHVLENVGEGQWRMLTMTEYLRSK